ncbi:TIGR04013 family B12-binding domain/radical SAM domain-containing protein [Anaeromyxobacter terrae]|uniref:TIGR04013 family B12-binding domain/radical SAM domain-containing protein n=1 Tax=Anaeromyxobacter terrae TaxID=2925406 RepID=UPI001F562570|nr:TIGR04013 family B12-binding domain/radical SAM domain-containing protein [Anaeromyxobacter sp. SG22]
MTTLVLHYRRTARHALNVLLGAVEAHPATAEVPVVFAPSPEAVADAARAALAAGRRPVVAWSFYTASFDEVAAELARVRDTVPDARVLHVAGGPHASADPAGTLAAGFDLVAIGEGEETLPALLARVAVGDDPRAGPGLAWLDGGGMRTSGRGPPVDLDALPPFAVRAGRIGPLEITRGCVWACRFCHTPFLFRARFRHRSLDTLARWARALAKVDTRDLRVLTPSALSWGSPDGGCDLAAIEALLATLREALGPGRRLFVGSFPSELRPEHVSPEALALLRRYCDNRTVVIGGQSGSDRLLASMQRGHDAESVTRAARFALEAGLTPSVDFIFGLPGEMEDDRRATRAAMGRLAAAGARVHAHAFMPLPGTPWAREPPGRLDAATQALLGRLAASGAAHGQWRRQEERALRMPPKGA